VLLELLEFPGDHEGQEVGDDDAVEVGRHDD
jgi:hypothetical protein